MTITNFIANWYAGKFKDPSREVQCEAGWFDWFCKDHTLQKRTDKLTRKLLSILPTTKFDPNTTEVIFKNNCPCDGSLYDDFRICNMEGDVLYTVVPSCGHNSTRGQAEVWGCENDFDAPLVEGHWADVKKFFKTA